MNEQESGLTQGGTGKSSVNGSQDSESGTGSQRSRSTMRGSLVGVVTERGLVLGGVMEIVPRESGLTPVGLILRGFAFVSGTIAEDGTFTPSSAEFVGDPDEMLGSDGSGSMGLREWSRSMRRRSRTLPNTD